MKILIIGNIGSGKTTLGKKFKELTHFKFVQIDELREKYLKNALSEEYLCHYHFLKSIEENENIIVEFTGVGCHKYAVKRALELCNLKTIIFLCLTRDFSTIQERVGNKTFNYINPFNINIKEHIQFVREELNKDVRDNFWESKNFQIIQCYMDNFNDLTNNIKRLENIIYSN